MKKGWEIKRLDDACEVKYGTRVVNKRDGGTIYPVYGGGGATFFMDSFNRENCLIIARFAMSEQCTRFVEGKFFLNDSGLSVRSKSTNEITQDFLDLQILYLNDHIYSLARGTAQKNLDVPAFRNIELNYPKSISEQLRIVQLLDKALEKIDTLKSNAERNLQNAKELFESALTDELKPRKGWEEKKLGELATFRNGMNFTRTGKGDVIQIVGVKDFQKSFWVPFDTLETVTLDGKLNEIDLLKENDILAVRSNGNPALIGRTLLSGKVNGNISHSGFTIRIRLDSSVISPIYLCHYLKTQKTRKELVDSGNGVGIKSLNQGSLSSLSIPFPKSLIEQQAIVQKLDTLSDQCTAMEVNYQKTIVQCEELKKAILAKAFNGEL